MRPIAISTRQESSYILESNRDDPPEEQVIFRLRGSLPLAVRTRILDAMSMDQSTRMISPEMGRRNLLACKAGILGWENLVDASGREVPCDMSGGEVSDRSMARLQDAWIIEIGSEIIARSQLSEEQAEK